MITRDIVLTGVPRSGTTLACKMLGEAPDTVALFEPMKVGELPASSRAEAVVAIGTFFADTRRSLLEHGTAVSQQIGGVVPDNPMTDQRNAAGMRQRAARRGEVRIEKPLTADFTLVVKHNAAFTALLPELAQRFSAFAIVRNPLAVLASWNSVELPVSRGRVPAGERLDPVLAARVHGEPDLFRRQLVILNWFCERFARVLPPERILRYEHVVRTGGQALAEACGVAVPPQPLEARNASRNYDPVLCAKLASCLREDAGAWRRFYDGDAIDRVEAELAGGAT